MTTSPLHREEPAKGAIKIDYALAGAREPRMHAHIFVFRGRARAKALYGSRASRQVRSVPSPCEPGGAEDRVVRALHGAPGAKIPGTVNTESVPDWGLTDL